MIKYNYNWFHCISRYLIKCHCPLISLCILNFNQDVLLSLKCCLFLEFPLYFKVCKCFLLSHVDYFGPSILETYFQRIVFLITKMYTYLFLEHFEMIYHINHFIAFFSEKAVAPHSSTFVWRIPWMEEPGRLQSMGSLRVGLDWVTSLSLFTLMHWRRKWQLTPVFLPGESQGRGSLVGCRLWGRTESDTTEAT